MRIADWLEILQIVYTGAQDPALRDALIWRLKADQIDANWILVTRNALTKILQEAGMEAW